MRDVDRHHGDRSGTRGQVGIGTLIVFIAMVLVAAIAAGVLINTAGFLQTQAEDTGTESTQQVADNMNVITTTGNVSGNDKINEVRIGVQPASGAGEINLAEVTLQFVSDDAFANIVVGNANDQSSSETAPGDTDPDNIRVSSGSARSEGDERFNVTVITAESENDIIMSDNSDRYEIVIPLDGTAEPGLTASDGEFNGALKQLSEGSEVEIKLTTEKGAQVTAFLQVPDSLTGEDPGSSINL